MFNPTLKTLVDSAVIAQSGAADGEGSVGKSEPDGAGVGFAHLVQYTFTYIGTNILKALHSLYIHIDTNYVMNPGEAYLLNREE
jgi:hypothetical protein